MRDWVPRISWMRGTQSENNQNSQFHRWCLSHSPFTLSPCSQNSSLSKLSWSPLCHWKSWSQLCRRNLSALSSEALQICRAAAFLLRRNQKGGTFSSEALIGSNGSSRPLQSFPFGNPSLLASCPSLPPPNLPFLQPQQDTPSLLSLICTAHFIFSWHPVFSIWVLSPETA